MPILENEDLTLAREALGDQSLSGDVAFTTLVAAVKAAGTQVATVEAEKLALSRDHEAELARVQEEHTLALSRTDNTTTTMDPIALSMFEDSLQVRREQAITSGGITEACAKGIDSLLMPQGKPTALALSRVGDGNNRPVIARIYDLLKDNGSGVKHGNAVARDAIVASRNAPNQSAVDADKPVVNNEPMKPERKAELLDMAGIRA